MEALVKQQQREIAQHVEHINQLKKQIAQLEARLDQYEAPALPPKRNRRVACVAERPGKLPERPDRKKSNLQQFLQEALMKNEFTRCLNRLQIAQMVEFMIERSLPVNTTFIREGDEGHVMYILESGQVDVTIQGNYIRTHKPGDIFGELAILHDQPRSATLTTTSSCTLWMLKREVYQSVMKNAVERRISRNYKLIQGFRFFKDLSDTMKKNIASAFEERYYEDGEYIIRQGDRPDSFYVIQSGTVDITKMVKGYPQLQNTMSAGDFFGEIAIDQMCERTANVVAHGADGVVCLCLDIADYKRLRQGRTGRRESATEIDIPSELRTIRLDEIKRVKTLGQGAFGRVDLVYVRNTKVKTYALKAMRKDYIVNKKQTERACAERAIMKELHHSFIVKLYRTFRDNFRVYMLMEVCLGGELYGLLKKQEKNRFNSKTARFYVACVVKAIDYLHSLQIVYRDLKPENLLVDAQGYVKLCDLGLAKELRDGSRTYTFCGTPDYIAPEVIQALGQTLAVDLWSLGILIYELLSGKAPFSGKTSADTYKKIPQGIEAAGFPHSIPTPAKKLIKSLCQISPTERIGYGGMEEVMNHTWFHGFDWPSLTARSMNAPWVPEHELSNQHDTRNFSAVQSDEGRSAAVEISGWDEVFDQL